MADDLWRSHFRSGHDLLERHHVAAVRARVELPQGLRIRAELLFRLDVDAIRPVVELEIVHVLRAQQDLHGARDLVERQAERERTLPVDCDLQLRIVRRERAERSEEHTSELQSQSNLVCRLLLEKKKKKNTIKTTNNNTKNKTTNAFIHYQ